jgi:hypothetical protein
MPIAAVPCSICTPLCPRPAGPATLTGRWAKTQNGTGIVENDVPAAKGGPPSF